LAQVLAEENGGALSVWKPVPADCEQSAMQRRVFFLSVSAVLGGALGGDDGNLETSTGTDNSTKPYLQPEVEGLHWAETFDGDVWSRWEHAQDEKYNGRFAVERRSKEALVGDLGLLVPEEARHYGAAATFSPIQGSKNVAFVVQFETKFQEGLACGGAYLKLFNSEGRRAKDFKENTPYVIMFGPDKCGGTDKVHFILQHKNPKTGTWEEKHCKDPPSVPHDQLSHLYTLIISPDNSFDILIDGDKKTSGNLLSSMQPPVNPPKEIDDPTDSKPEDWIDEVKMDDPTSSKPDDWDEDAPMQIADPKARMPSGWNQDAQQRIPDPAAKVPADWDEEEDGEWEAPIIDNPACKVGCGKWEPPKISNPAYKGKWYAPKIDNPLYKGVWKARQVENPNYFVDETPCMLPQIDSVGIDIWTMSKGIMFDNIVVATDPAKAKAFGDASWSLRRDVEKLQEPKGSFGNEGTWLSFASKNLVALVVTGVVALISTAWCCCARRSGGPPRPVEAAPRKLQGTDEGSRPQEEVIAGKEEEKAQETEEEKAHDAGEERQGAAAASEAGKKVPVEGGLGDISGGDS